MTWGGVKRCTIDREYPSCRDYRPNWPLHELAISSAIQNVTGGHMDHHTGLYTATPLVLLKLAVLYYTCQIVFTRTINHWKQQEIEQYLNIDSGVLFTRFVYLFVNLLLEGMDQGWIKFHTNWTIRFETGKAHILELQDILHNEYKISPIMNIRYPL